MEIGISPPPPRDSSQNCVVSTNVSPLQRAWRIDRRAWIKNTRWNKERKVRWQRRGGGIRLELVPRVPSDVSSRRNACTSDVRRPMYIIYEVSAFPAMINQPATPQEPRAFEALRGLGGGKHLSLSKLSVFLPSFVLRLVRIIRSNFSLWCANNNSSKDSLRFFISQT